MPQDAPPNGSAPDQRSVGSWSRVAEMQAKHRLHRAKLAAFDTTACMTGDV